MLFGVHLGRCDRLRERQRVLGDADDRDAAELKDGDIDGLGVAAQLEEHHVWVGSEKFRSTVAAASLFSRMKEGVSAQLLDLSDAVVTVPANATGGARYRTRAAAALGGVRVRVLPFGPDGTPLQHGLADELTRLLAHTVRPFANGSSNVRHLSAAESASARPAPIDTSAGVVEVDPAVTFNGEPRGVSDGGTLTSLWTLVGNLRMR
ncbi:hypothetical protein ACWDO6_23160 [Streptomyces sp. NPDC003674]